MDVEEGDNDRVAVRKKSPTHKDPLETVFLFSKNGRTKRVPKPGTYIQSVALF